MRRELQIIISARNAVQAGLTAAGNAIRRFGAGVASIAQQATRALLGIGATLASLAGVTLAAWAKQEKALQELRGALRFYGDDADALIPRLENIASAIQAETGVSDDLILARMARLRLMGLEMSQLEQAAKATVALAAYGMEEEAAIKAIMAARSGDFSLLQRYIPVLRNATTDAEKAALVNQLLTAGYAQMREKTQTLTGAWQMFKNAISDAAEGMGQAIERNGWMSDVLRQSGTYIAEHIGKLSGLAHGFRAGGASGREFAEHVRYAIYRVIGWIAVVASAIEDGLTAAFQYVSNFAQKWFAAMRAQFDYLAGWVVAIGKKIKSPFSEFEAPDTSGIKAAIKEYFDAISGKGVRTKGLTVAALEELDELQKDHLERLRKIREEEAAAGQAGAQAAEQITIAAESAAKAEEERQKKIEELRKREAKLGEELEKAERDAMREKWKEEIAGIEAAIKKREELAEKTVQAVLDEMKAEEKKKKAREEEDKRAAQLEARLARGARLSRRDEEWLAAYRRIRRAEKELPQLRQDLEVAKENLKELERQGRTLREIRDELSDVGAQLQTLLRMA